MVEGKEGIFSTKEMANLGKENFYALKSMASKGALEKDFFKEQRVGFMQAVPVNTGNSAVLSKMDELIGSVKGIPGTNWEVASVSNGIMKLIEHSMRNGKLVRNTHIIKAPRN